MAIAKLSAVSERAKVSMEFAQKALNSIKQIPKEGAWAKQVKIDGDNYVVGQPKLRTIVVVLPVPFLGDQKPYNVMKSFVSVEQFLELLEKD